jgi:hypothetical protein
MSGDRGNKNGRAHHEIQWRPGRVVPCARGMTLAIDERHQVYDSMEKFWLTTIAVWPLATGLRLGVEDGGPSRYNEAVEIWAGSQMR